MSTVVADYMGMVTDPSVKPRIKWSPFKRKWVAKSKFPKRLTGPEWGAYYARTIRGEGKKPQTAYNGWLRMYKWTAQGRPGRSY